MGNISKFITRSLLLGTLTIPLTGCISEGYQLYQYATRATVTYSDERAFECTQTHMPNGSRDFSACAKCQNMSAIPQHVVIAETPYEVPPRAVLMSCQSKAWILE